MKRRERSQSLNDARKPDILLLIDRNTSSGKHSADKRNEILNDLELTNVKQSGLDSSFRNANLGHSKNTDRPSVGTEGAEDMEQLEWDNEIDLADLRSIDTF